MARAWYGFVGGPDVTNISNYYISHRKTELCLCGTTICAVYVPEGGMHPPGPFSSNIEAYIKKALVTGQLQPDHPFGAKKYVYLKY